MLKIGIVTDPNTPPSVRFYRTTGVLHYLTKLSGGNFQVEEVPQANLLRDESAAFAFDACLIERPITPPALSIIHHLKNLGCAVWLDYDDNLLDIPDYNNAQDYFTEQQAAETVRQALTAADIVTCATEYLTKLYKGINPNTITIQNAWNDFRHAPLAEPSPAHTPIRMAWRGANKHDGDLFGVRAVLATTLQDPAFDWKFFGYRPFYLGLTKQQYVKWAGIATYFRTFFTAGVDYLFVPLEVNNFNRGKSNLSWIEATVAGAVTIAPAGLPEFDRPGVIRYKDNRHLADIFAKVKAGKYDKAERVQASREELRENYALSRVNAIRAGVLAKMFGMEIREPEQKSVE